MQQISIKKQEQAQLDGEGDPQGIVQETEIYHTNKWYTHKPEDILENEMHRILWVFER